MLEGDCKKMDLVINAIEGSLAHEKMFPERLRFNDLQEQGMICLAHAAERTEFSTR